MNNRFIVFWGITCSIFLGACSLNYGNNDISENVVPEVVSVNSQFSRIEDESLTFQVNAEKIEQYKDSPVSYSQNLTFISFNKDGTKNTEGYCDLLTADSEKQEYFLLNNISIQNYSRNLTIIAKNLQWNGKTEQLVGAKNEAITIKKDKITLTGKGFSASAVSNSFNFSDSVSGSLNSNKESVETNLQGLSQ